MGSPACHDREPQILALWEHGAGLGRWERDDALLASLACVPPALGARNAALLALRVSLFDRAWPLRSRCPACGMDCEFVADCFALAEQLNAVAGSPSAASVDCSGRSFALRAPTVDDLREISASADARSAARTLLARCVSGDMTVDELDEDTAAALEAQLERLDPGAVVSFALRCPSCGYAWSAAIDVGDALWSEVQRAAERSLVEIDALARAYGWREREVLRLSPTRRAAYLQLVGAS